MTEEPSISSRLSLLVNAACDDMATADQWHELETILADDETARSWYLDYCRLHVDLYSAIGAGQSMEAVKTKVYSEPLFAPTTPDASFFGNVLYGPVRNLCSTGWPVAYLIATAIFAIGALIGAFIPVSQPSQVAVERNTSTPQPLIANPNRVVGQVTGMVRCHWAGTERVSREVALGTTYHLASGLMEIAYNTGARVILQGPCTYEVDSTDGGFLTIGKLTARVESGGGGRGAGDEGRFKVQGSRFKAGKSPNLQIPNPNSSPQPPAPSPLFTVRTPTATVTDLGTEFGVEVSKGGATDVLVLTGKVKIEGCGEALQAGKQVLTAGQAARVNSHRSGIERITRADASFIRRLPAAEETTVFDFVAQIDYSDTFTVNSPTRPGSNLVLRELMQTDPNVLRVEHFPGNPMRFWDVPGGTVITSWPEDARWPGFKVQGSRSGLLEASGDCRCGFEYGVRDDFVVQFDAVQTADRITVTVGESIHFTDGSPTLSVFFRPAGGRLPEIGVYHPQAGEVDSGLRSGIARAHDWYNYAVRFNLPARQLTVWVDRELRGVVDLDVLKDGDGRAALAGQVWTSRRLSIGGLSPEDDKRRIWFDNFAVGSPREKAK